MHAALLEQGKPYTFFYPVHWLNWRHLYDETFKALIYWLRLPYREVAGEAADKLPDISSPWRNTEDYHRELDLLRRTVEESGGRVELLSSLAEITPAFAGILAELREQYVLGFYPGRARHDGSWHRLAVRVRTPGAEVRCREGYVDY